MSNSASNHNQSQTNNSESQHHSPDYTELGEVSEETSQVPSSGMNQALASQQQSGWQIGTTVKDANDKEYLVTQKLGEGGFGVTYLVTEQKTNTQLVIKMLKDELNDDERVKQEFLNEALKLKGCFHENIVRVIELIKVDKKDCIVMEYINGNSLKQLVADNGNRLNLDEALKYIFQIGKALIYAHNNNNEKLLHRDIKPDNILINNQKKAILIDFGLALNIMPNQRVNNTALTPGYAPIEQYQQGAKLDCYTDVYALAATLYYLLTGQIPKPANQRAKGEIMPPPQGLNSSISPAINNAIMQGLKLEASERPQTVKAWLDLLKNKPNNQGLIKNNSKLFLLTFVSIIIIIMGSLLIFNYLRNNKLTEIFCLLTNCQIELKNEYSNPEYNFKLKYPLDWKYVNIEDPVTHEIVKFEPKLNSGNEQILIQVEQLNSPISLEQLSQLSQTTIQKHSQNSKILVNNLNQSLAGFSAYQLIYTVDQDDHVTKKKMELGMIRGDYAYIITYEATEGDYSKFEPTAQAIADSLMLLNP